MTIGDVGNAVVGDSEVNVVPSVPAVVEPVEVLTAVEK